VYPHDTIHIQHEHSRTRYRPWGLRCASQHCAVAPGVHTGDTVHLHGHSSQGTHTARRAPRLMRHSSIAIQYRHYNALKAHHALCPTSLGGATPPGIPHVHARNRCGLRAQMSRQTLPHGTAGIGARSQQTRCTTCIEGCGMECGMGCGMQTCSQQNGMSICIACASHAYVHVHAHAHLWRRLAMWRTAHDTTLWWVETAWIPLSRILLGWIPLGCIPQGQFWVESHWVGSHWYH